MVNRYMKRFSLLLIIREKQIKTTMRHHLTLARMTIIKSLQTINAGEDMEKREPSYIVNGDVSWYSHYGKQYRGSWKKLKIELPYDPAVPFLGIYPEKMEILTWKDIHTPMFMHTHELWKQLKCPLTDEWVKKKWCIYAMEYYTAIKKNKISPFAAILMPLEIITLSEVSWTEKDKYYMIFLESKKQCKLTYI